MGGDRIDFAISRELRGQTSDSMGLLPRFVVSFFGRAQKQHGLQESTRAGCSGCRLKVRHEGAHLAEPPK